jgi:acyl carrier protein
MELICKLEETFHISFKGRETMKIKSFGAGLELVKKKLGEANEAK